MIRRGVRARSLALFVAAMAALPMAASPLAGQEGTRLNYVNAELDDVIRSLAAVLGVNVLLTEDVPSTRVTYTTQQPVPAEQVGAVLEAILESQGLVLVRRGPVAEVMPAEQAPYTGPVTFGKEIASPPPLGLITQIVPLEHISAEEGITMLQQVASPLARLETVPRSNAVLITDLGTNVVRYLELLRGLDVPSEGEMGLRTFVVRLKHANATELAITLGQVFGATVPIQFAERERVRALGDRSLSSTLEGFRDQEAAALEMRRQTPIPLSLQAASPAVDTARGGAAGADIGAQTIIVPEPATNSLVIRTSPPNFPTIEQTIYDLDVRPPQVLLDVYIVEVQLDEALEYGVNWSVFAEDKGGVDFTSRFGPQAFSDSALGGVDDFVLRAVRLNSVDVRGVLRALAAETDVRVLSNPSVTALNNEEARILVGSQVPFNSSTRAGLDVVVDRVIQYRDVGTNLTVIPTINDDGYVTFRILQEVSSLTGATLSAALDAPIINTREAETSAIVRNGETIVIGGLIDHGTEFIERGVPILKDIPLLGLLFRSRSEQDISTELAIFVTPYVIYTDEDAEEIFQRERRRLEELQNEFGVEPRTPPTRQDEISSPPIPQGEAPDSVSAPDENGPNADRSFDATALATVLESISAWEEEAAARGRNALDRGERTGS